MRREEEDRGMSTADPAAMAQQMQHQQPHAGRDDVDPMREQYLHEQPPAQERQDEAASPQARQPAMQEVSPAGHRAGSPEPLAALFPIELAQEFRSRWDAVQIGFVDDPQRAVQQADELVSQVMRSLADSFAQQRGQIEAGVREAGNAATENQRIALQRYRSFFQRLLTL